MSIAPPSVKTTVWSGAVFIIDNVSLPPLLFSVKLIPVPDINLEIK